MQPGDEEQDIDQLRQDAELEDRQRRINKLEDAGAVYDSENHYYSLSDKFYDADANPL